MGKSGESEVALLGIWKIHARKKKTVFNGLENKHRDGIVGLPEGRHSDGSRG